MTDLEIREINKIYEQPLNERARLLLRLESVFMQAVSYKSALDKYEIQLCLDAIFSLLNLTRRYELRSECLKELERIRSVLQTAKNSDKTSNTKADLVLGELSKCVDNLHNIDTKMIDKIRNIEFLNIIKQRNIHDTGSYIFEIPELQYWLHQTSDFRQEQIEVWLSHFMSYKESVDFLLRLIRESAVPSCEIAESGMFLKTIDSKIGSHQLLRVEVTSNHNVFPRISGGRHRFAIRFMTQDKVDSRAKQTNEDIKFNLQTCLI